MDHFFDPFKPYMTNFEVVEHFLINSQVRGRPPSPTFWAILGQFWPYLDPYRPNP